MRSICLVVLLGLLFFCSCANHPRQFALDYGPVQIGCCWRWSLDEPYESKRTRSPNLRIGIPFWIWNSGKHDAGNVVNGLNLALLADCSKATNGLAMAMVASTDAKGVVIAPIGYLADRLDGLSLALFNVIDDGRSFQVGLINGRGVMARADLHGIAQIGILNHSYCTATNVQIGALNYCEDTPYLQIGLVNFTRVDEPHFALQVGLWNDNNRWSFPLVNITW